MAQRLSSGEYGQGLDPDKVKLFPCDGLDKWMVLYGGLVTGGIIWKMKDEYLSYVEGKGGAIHPGQLEAIKRCLEDTLSVVTK